MHVKNLGDAQKHMAHLAEAKKIGERWQVNFDHEISFVYKFGGI